MFPSQASDMFLFYLYTVSLSLSSFSLSYIGKEWILSICKGALIKISISKGHLSPADVIVPDDAIFTRSRPS